MTEEQWDKLTKYVKRTQTNPHYISAYFKMKKEIENESNDIQVEFMKQIYFGKDKTANYMTWRRRIVTEVTVTQVAKG